MAIDVNTPEGRIRLRVGDIQDVPILPDSIYTYYYQVNNSNENRTIVSIAYAILAALSQNTRERLDRIEYYGQEAFDNYLKFINVLIKDPRTSMTIAGVYCGGLSKEDMRENDSNPDVNTSQTRPLPITPVNLDWVFTGKL